MQRDLYTWAPNDPDVLNTYSFNSFGLSSNVGINQLSSLGKFISQVILTQGQSNPQLLNPYLYCSNNPVNWIDPWGFDKQKKDRSWGENLQLYLLEVGTEMEKGYMTNMQGLFGIIGVGTGAYSNIGYVPRAIGYSNKDLIQGGRIAYRWANQYGSGVKLYSWGQMGALGSFLAVASAAMTGWTVGETINAYYWGYQNYKQKYNK